MKVTHWIWAIAMLAFYCLSPHVGDEQFWTPLFYTATIGLGLCCPNRTAKAQLWCLWILFVTSYMFQGYIAELFAGRGAWYRYVCGVIFALITILYLYRYDFNKKRI